VNVAVDVVDQIIDVFRGETARAAVNIPAMRPDVLAPVKPYLMLSEKLGKFASQIIDGAITEVEVSYLGDIAEHNTSPLTVSVMKGVLETALAEAVNIVNASLLAKERGIKVKETKGSEAENFSNLISVKVTSDKGSKIVSGTVFGSFGERIVRIDNFKTDVVPQGYMIITSHTDKPGIIGATGTLLGNNKINIASMDVGRESIGGKAVMVLNVDVSVPDNILRQVEKIEGVVSAKLVKI